MLHWIALQDIIIICLAYKLFSLHSTLFLFVILRKAPRCTISTLELWPLCKIVSREDLLSMSQYEFCFTFGSQPTVYSSNNYRMA